MTNKNQLRILFVEDLPTDVELAVLELRKEGLRFEHIRVDTRDEFIKALKEFIPDIVISDYMMPSYNGMQVLKDAREFDPSVPFILLTGSMNEETAVECLKAGATDYIIKEHLTRLPFAIKEALEQRRIQIEKRAAELLLKENEEKLESIFSAAPVGIGLVVNRVFMEVNDTFCKMTGYNRKELIGKTFEMIYCSREEQEFASLETDRQISEKGVASIETRLKCKDDRILNIIAGSSPLDACDLSKGSTFTVLDITKRKLAEGALQESQHLFQTLAKVSPVGIFRTNPDGYTTYVNPKYLELMGLSFEEALGFGWLNAVHPDDKEKIKESWKSDYKSQRISNAEYRFLRPDGSIVWVMGNAVPDLIDNEIIGYIGTITDITGYKQAEKALEDERNLLRTIVDLLPTHIFVKDRESRFLMANIACARFMGATSIQELIGKTDAEFYKAEAPAGFRSDELDVLEGIPVVNKEEGSDSPTGTPRNLLTTKVPLRDGEGNIIGLVGANFDITEARLADKALRESEEKYRRIFENVQDMFYVSSIDGIMLEVSPSIELISKGQYKRDDIIGKSMFDFFKEPADGEALMRVLQERGFVSDFEITLTNRDGSHIPCSVSSRICFDAQGHPEKIIGSMRDITDLKNASDTLKLAKEKAEANDKLKTTFLNNISHEVRTPLNGILGFAEIMSQPDLSEEEKNFSLSMLFESSDRLLDTITNYIDISLITSGNMAVNKKDFVPAQIVNELSGKYKSLCSARKLELILKIPEHYDNLSVNSDPEIFGKILSHLLSNAIKFTEKGSIKYGYTIREKEFEFFVTDTGIGIGKESLESVFDRFVKEEYGPLKVTEGSGLGLSISKGLTEILGGKMWVESEKGKGSTFFFTIPQSKENKIDRPVLKTDQQNKTIIVKSILVAEDDETNFFYLKILLKHITSATVIHASNGREAIDKFKQNPDIGLILMDIKMPVMDGMEATREIKAIKRDIPVIAITAYAMPGDEARMLDAGCDYYLTKPINKKLLLEKIAEYIGLEKY